MRQHRAWPATSGGRDSVPEGGAALRGGHRRPSCRRPGQGKRAGQSGPPAVPDPGTAPLGGARRLVLAQARYTAGDHSAALFRYADKVAIHLEASRAGEAMQAHLLAGRIALSRGSVTEADPHLERAARSRRRGPPLTRSVAWLARALQADARATPGHRRRLYVRPRRPRGAPDEARSHRVACVRHGTRRRAGQAGPARCA